MLSVEERAVIIDRLRGRVRREVNAGGGLAFLTVVQYLQGSKLLNTRHSSIYDTKNLN